MYRSMYTFIHDKELLIAFKWAVLKYVHYHQKRHQELGDWLSIQLISISPTQLNFIYTTKIHLHHLNSSTSFQIHIKLQCKRVLLYVIYACVPFSIQWNSIECVNTRVWHQSVTSQHLVLTKTWVWISIIGSLFSSQ